MGPTQSFAHLVLACTIFRQTSPLGALYYSVTRCEAQMRLNHPAAAVPAFIIFTALINWGLTAPPGAPGRAPSPPGRQVFIQYCASCHGEKRDGKPASGLRLKPPALDLTGYELSESFIRKVLQEGVLGTGMAGWNSLPPQQLSAVTAYTATLAHVDQLRESERVAADNVLQEAGRRVYVVHCTRCHGQQGQGNGPEASGSKPPPADFSAMRPTYAEAARVIAEGVPGSAMAAWPRLTRAEVQAVTFYIRSLYRGRERRLPQATPKYSRTADK
jgi:mono/diheme cytochrome c family protein